MSPSLEPQPSHRESESFPAAVAAPHRLDVTVERAPVGIAHFDHSGRLLLVNPQLCAIFGLTRSQLLAKTFQEISFPEDLPRCLEMTQRLASGVIPRYTLEKRFVRPDGAFVYCRVIVTAVQDAGSEHSFFLAVVEDLSEQWEAEQARRAAEERLSVALDASATGIYRYDFQSQALEWSNGLARVFGFPEGDVLHSLDRLLGAIHPDDLPVVLEAYQRSATRGDDFDEEFRIVLPDGSVRWICDRARMTLDLEGMPRYLTGACLDITKQREAEAARSALLDRERAARADAEQAIRLRDEMLAIVAHDLRNPVHTIMMGVGAALDLDLSKEDHDRQLQLIQRSARGMDALIRDLLDVNQIEMGRLAIAPKPSSVEDMVDDAVFAVSKLASDRGLHLVTEIPPGLPSVRADRLRVVQVLGNLLSNAIKFTPRDGRVTVRATALDGSVAMSVEDTGRGIAPDHLARVFDRYWQADRTARHGVGLGLAIARGIIDAHGGEITVESELGAGTTFRITLPSVADA